MIDSHLDREDWPSQRFEEAHERIPSSVGLAEGAYRGILRQESIKHEKDGIGYLEWGGPFSEKTDWNYQHWYSKTLGEIKSVVGHQYKADRTVAF